MIRAIRLLIAVWIWALCAPLAQAEQAATALARLMDGAITDSRAGGVAIDLDLDQGVPWRVFHLTDPWRVVVDFRELAPGGVTPAALDRSERVLTTRLGRYRPGWTRMVLELDQPLAVDRAELRVDPESGAARLSMTLVPQDAIPFAATAGLPADPDWGTPKSVAPPPRAGDGPILIVLDPGHGGIDPGAQRAGHDEADLVLTFARQLRDVLRRTGRYTVVMTRDADVFVSLEARVAIAQQVGADLFLSLHADAIAEGIAHGATAYTLSDEASDAASEAMAIRHERDDLLAGLDLSGTDDRVSRVLMDLARLDNTPRSSAFAAHLIDGIAAAGNRVHKRPLRQAGFSVLKAPGIPSVLLEIGFISTTADLRNLQDPAWRAGMAAGIRDGIDAWVREDAALADLRLR